MLPPARCDVVQWQDTRLLPGQRWFDPSRRSSFLGRLTAGSSALNRRMRGSNPARGARFIRTRTWRPCGLQHRRRGFDSFRPCFTPRSSSRPGCRSLTPVTRVRTPLGALIDATVVSGRKHTALPAPQTGFDPRRSLHGALGGQDGGLHPPERGSIPRGSILSAEREPLWRFPLARIPEGVRRRGRKDSDRVARSRTRLVARPGCLPGEAGSTPVESAHSSP